MCRAAAAARAVAVAALAAAVASGEGSTAGQGGGDSRALEGGSPVLSEPLLFMALDDVTDTWGLIWPTANTVVPSTTYVS